MAVNTGRSNHINWWAWGGAAAATILLIAAVGFWLDWFGTGTTDISAPAAEPAAPESQ